MMSQRQMKYPQPQNNVQPSSNNNVVGSREHNSLDPRNLNKTIMPMDTLGATLAQSNPTSSNAYNQKQFKISNGKIANANIQPNTARAGNSISLKNQRQTVVDMQERNKNSLLGI